MLWSFAFFTWAHIATMIPEASPAGLSSGVRLVKLKTHYKAIIWLYFYKFTLGGIKCLSLTVDGIVKS